MALVRRFAVPHTAMLTPACVRVLCVRVCSYLVKECGVALPDALADFNASRVSSGVGVYSDAALSFLETRCCAGGGDVVLPRVSVPAWDTRTPEQVAAWTSTASASTATRYREVTRLDSDCGTPTIDDPVADTSALRPPLKRARVGSADGDGGVGPSLGPAAAALAAPGATAGVASAGNGVGHGGAAEGDGSGGAVAATRPRSTGGGGGGGGGGGVGAMAPPAPSPAVGAVAPMPAMPSSSASPSPMGFGVVVDESSSASLWLLDSLAKLLGVAVRGAPTAKVRDAAHVLVAVLAQS